MRCFRVGARDVLVAHVDGEVYAVDDLCTHEDAALSSGVLSGTTVRCPLHGAIFNLVDGAALEEPGEEPLRTFPARIDAGDVQVRVDPR